MRAKTECMLLLLDAAMFQQTATSSGVPEMVDFPTNYATGFLKHLNSVNENGLTDLDDPEMDVEWMSARAYPQKKHKRRGSGLRPSGHHLSIQVAKFLPHMP